MAENLTIASPDLDEIRKEAGTATENAVNLLWRVLNQEIRDRRRTVRIAAETDSGKVLISTATTDQSNFDSKDATTIQFTGGSAFNFSGIRSGTAGRRILVHNLGAGTITLKHNATSDAANRFFLDTGADKSLVQNASIVFIYLNGGWREMNLL